VLSRVKNAMSDPLTWNGFEKAHRRSEAPQDRDAPAPMAGPHRRSPAMHLPAVATAAVASDHQLRSLGRRVPGASLSPLEPVPDRAAGVPAADQDPEQARSLVEQFESGVAHALQLHDTSRKRDQHHE
jgi:hypothetical protein